jgi:hypothetical protein
MLWWALNNWVKEEFCMPAPMKPCEGSFSDETIRLHEESTYQLQSEVVIYGDLDIPFGAQIPFGGLDGGVPQQELNLL